MATRIWSKRRSVTGLFSAKAKMRVTRLRAASSSKTPVAPVGMGGNTFSVVVTGFRSVFKISKSF